MSGAAGTISGSAIGYAHGNGWLSAGFVYWFCAIINVLVGVFGWVALSGRRNNREASADTLFTYLVATPLPFRRHAGLTQEVMCHVGPAKRDDHGPNASTPFFSGFRHTAFTALFVAITISSLGPMFMGTFLQCVLAP